MAGLAARQEREGQADEGALESAARAARDAIEGAIARVAAHAGAGGALLARALVQLTEATAAAEELAARQAAIGAAARDAYDQGLADGRAVRRGLRAV